nr:small heat shock protein [Pareurythoe californica]
MFRAVIPRVCNASRQALRPVGARSYYKRHHWVPMTREGRSLIDDFFGDRFPRWALKVADHQMRNMERRMEDMVGPWYVRHGSRRVGSKQVEVKYDDKVYEVKVDVHEFSPEELNVKIVEDRLVISGKLEDRPDDHGFISREMKREFIIPENVEVETIESHLTDEGFLKICGKVKGGDEAASERVINITREPPKEGELPKEGESPKEGDTK